MHCLEVWGELACFTRPEMKVERFSYPIITPSAARGIFDAIYWEGIRDMDRVRPYFYWQVRRIEVLKPPRYIALRRNEVKDKAPLDKIRKRMSGDPESDPRVWADAGEDFFLKEGGKAGDRNKGRTQRQTMALKDVHYRIYADIVPHTDFRADAAKFNTMFERRAKRGQCFQQPYFGCREFPAYFEWRDAATSGSEADKNVNLKLGWMLYDVFDLTRANVSLATAEPCISVFEANVMAGVLEVPSFTSEAVRKPSRN